MTAIFPIQTGFLDPPLPSASAESLSRHSLCAGTAGSMAPNATYLPVSLVSLAGVEVRVRKNYRDEGTVSALYLFFKRVGKVATCLRGIGIFAAVCPAYGPEGEGRFEALLLIVEWAAICASNLQLKLADKEECEKKVLTDRLPTSAVPASDITHLSDEPLLDPEHSRADIRSVGQRLVWRPLRLELGRI